MKRTFVCPQCPPGADVHPAGARGPLPTACRRHLVAAKNRRARRDRIGLHVVDPDAVPAAAGIAIPAAPPAAEPTAALPVDDVPPTRPERITAVVRRELADVFSTHPAAETLTALALILAGQLEHPLTIADARIVATVGRELRATLDALTAKRQEAAGVDDPFGLAGLPAAVGNATQT